MPIASAGNNGPFIGASNLSIPLHQNGPFIIDMDNIPGYQGAARLSYVPDTLYNIVQSLSCFQHNVYTLLSAHLVMLKCAPRFLVQKYVGESHNTPLSASFT